MNTVEFVKDIFKSYTKVDDTPLHVGEVMNLWTMLVATENFLNSELVAYNEVKDQDLKAKMKDLMENFHKVLIHDIRQILLKENVELATSPTTKPIVPIDTPAGGKMTDEETANLVVFNLVWAIKFCARGMTEALRADVGTLFAKWIMEKAAYAVTLRAMMAEKGWIKVPPPYKTN